MRAARECERGGDSFVSEERAALDATLARVGFLAQEIRVYIKSSLFQSRREAALLWYEAKNPIPQPREPAGEQNMKQRVDLQVLTE